MEITLDNYSQKEKDIISDIEKSAFISLDLELTGIVYNLNFLDSPSERYNRLKLSSEKFKIIQFGLVPWIKNEINGKISYIAKPYNIFCFPNEDSGNLQINCEISSMIFNREHGMDFNKWIRKGVNYLNSKQYKKLSENTLDNNINLYNPDDKKKYKNVSLYRDEEKEKYNEFQKSFSEFIHNDNETILKTEKFPRFFLLYIINNIQKEIRDKLYITQNKETNEIIFKKINENEKQGLIDSENLEKITLLNKSKGVKNIFDAITKNKKIIVGHNCILDILFCISHFGDSLPNSYQDFKKIINLYFNGIYDTKFIYNSHNNENRNESFLESVYEKLYNLYGKNVEITIPENEGFKNYLKNNSNDKISYHQADYDAFVTGSAFVYLINMIGEKEIEKYNYKIHIMKTFYKCFNLNGPEEFECPNTIPYCIKSKNKSCDFPYHQIVTNKELLNEIKKTYFIEGYNSQLILVETKDRKFFELERELMENGSSYFDIMQLDDFKKFVKEEEAKKSKKFKY
jgi:poly(A)-specific ribonuclease